jgi:parallel beta-helix repeat protein
MRRINLHSATGAKSIVFLLFAGIVALSTTLMAETSEVTRCYVTANGNDRYDRNPAFVQFGGENWLFYTKGDNDATLGVRNGTYNPDNDSYTIWYKRVSSSSGPDHFITAAEIRLDLSATARPDGFDQRDVSAVVFQGNLYVFASAGFGGSQQPIYFYKWDGAVWTGPTALLTGGGGHANAVADVDRVYFTLEKGVPDTMRSVAYTWDGAIFNGPYVIAEDNGVPKLTLMDGILYAVSIAPSANTINLHTAPASATPSTWSYVSDPIAVSDAGVYVWDPSIFHDGSTLYVLAAPSATWPDMQWIVQARSADNGASWTHVKRVSAGGPGGGSTFWWEFWPIGWSDSAGRIMIFFATEGANGLYGDGAIGGTYVDWNLDKDHGFYIQQAIDATIPGDTVIVGDGDYSGFGNYDLRYGKRITVKSKNGAWNTSINCSGLTGEAHQGFHFFYGEDSTTVLDGFWITGSNNFQAAVACSASSPTIKNCLIRNNTTNGVYVNNAAHPRFQNCTIEDNTGRGIFVKATNPETPSVIISHCTVRNNGSDGILIDHAFASIDSTNLISNQGNGLIVNDFDIKLTATNLFARGNTDYGIRVALWGGFFTIRNCTVVDNGNGIGYDFELPKGSTATASPQADSNYIVNCISAFNKGRGFVGLFASPWDLAANCNDAYGNAGGNYSGDFGAGDNAGNISLDPLFCDTASQDYRIAEESPCAPANNSCHTLIGWYGIGCKHSFLCGDANADGSVDISDVVYMISFIFSGGLPPSPYLSGDANCDGQVDISDAVYLIAYIFSGGSAPCANCPGAPTGAFLGMGVCKGFLTALDANAGDELKRCVQWQYNGSGTLLLKHVNAIFNCCPEIETQVTITENTITIQEIEIEGLCDCMCTYDLDYQISNLPAGQYTINVIEPYSSPPLLFTADLTTTPTGEYCVTSK